MHTTIARFRTLHFAPCAEQVMAGAPEFLYKSGEISGEAVFIGWDKNRGERQQIHICMGPPPLLCQARVCVISFAESLVWPPRQESMKVFL